MVQQVFAFREPDDHITHVQVSSEPYELKEWNNNGVNF